MSLVYKQQLLIEARHIDVNNHVNNVQYVQWVQDIAEAHWNELKTLTPYQHDYWFLMDHFIQYKKQVFLGDTITIETYPETPIGLKQPRTVNFYCNNELVAISKTHWLLIDKDTKKMKRIETNWLDGLNT
jgi:acyl-CoA thioester hydrolase